MGSGGASEDDSVPRWWASAPFPGGCVTLGCTSPGVLQCTRCHVARYCGQVCQRRHWKGPLPRGAQTHRDFCVDDYSEQRAIEIAGPERDGGGRDGGVCAGHFAGVVVEVGPGEGSGLLNPMVNHVLPAAKPYLASALVLAGFGLRPTRAGLLRGLRSPFAEVLGWDVRMFVDPSSHAFSRREETPSVGSTVHAWTECMGPGTHGRDTASTGSDADVEGLTKLNASAVFFGCSAEDGMSPYRFIMGKAYVVGRHSATGQPLTGNVLWGILNFIYEAMDCFSDMEEEECKAMLDERAASYRARTWEPIAGLAGVDIYECDPHKCVGVCLAPWADDRATIVHAME